MLLNKTLKNLGLSEKEAKVYLAALELGAQPVQEIAKKAGVNRATTYVMIESLTQKGLMSSFEKGKKRYFNAEEPERLFNIIKSQEREIKEQEAMIKKIMPDLSAIYAVSEHKPRVRFFEGMEGVQNIQDDILESKTNYIDAALDIDEYRKHFSDQDFAEYRKEIMKRKIKQRIMFTTQGPPPDAMAEKEKFTGTLDYKYIPKQDFNFPGELTIYANRVALYTTKGKVIGVIIDSPEINQMIKAFYDITWKCMVKR